MDVLTLSSHAGDSICVRRNRTKLDRKVRKENGTWWAVYVPPNCQPPHTHDGNSLCLKKEQKERINNEVEKGRWPQEEMPPPLILPTWR